MAGRLEFEFGFGRPPGRPRAGDDPMRILLVGDFSGRGGRGRGGEVPLGERRPRLVDVDNFEDVMARFAPGLALPLDGEEGGVEIEFRELDDFHPDALYRRLDIFRALRRMRTRLLDPAEFAAAAAELRRDAGGPPEAPDVEEGRPSGAEAAASEGSGSTLERLLGGTPSEHAGGRDAAPASRAGLDVDRLVGRVVAPYITPAADPQQDQYVASVDAAIGDQMRAVLHHPSFQALEAAWRGVYGLVTSLETGEELKLYLLDASKAEIAADLAAAGHDLRASGLYRALVERGVGTPGGEPWSLLVGDFAFAAAEDDIALLAALGAVASQAGGPFLAAAEASLLGCRSLAETPDPADWHLDDAETEALWAALRRSASAQWLGLAAPRVLVRLPYGAQSDEIDAFEFEEVPSVREHGAFLWGNPAFACAALIAGAFTERGWAMRPGDLVDVEDLPACTYYDQGEAAMVPCAEVFLGERAIDAILARGVMPLASYRNRNAARLVRFQSLAEPPAALAGPWD